MRSTNESVRRKTTCRPRGVEMHVPSRFSARLARRQPSLSTRLTSQHPATRQCCPTRSLRSSMPSSNVANSKSDILQPSILSVLYSQTRAHTNKHRRISHHHPSSTSTGLQQPANRQYFAPTCTSPAFRTLSSTSANASPHDTSWSASSHRPSMRSTNTTTRRLIDAHMRVPRT
jgi:hypothetical protein